MIKKTCLIVTMIFSFSCSGITKDKDSPPDHDYLIGTWKFVRYVVQPVGRYVKKQYNQIIDRDLIITKDSIYFDKPLSFIEPCGNFKWKFSRVEEFMRLDFRRQANGNLGNSINISSNCDEDIRPSYLKKDTLISFNGGIVTYRVKAGK